MDIKTYLESHSLDADFVKKTFGWKWDEEKITIPYIENGKHLFNRYRWFDGEQKFTADKGSHSALYCPTKIKDKEWLVFCEGEADMVRLWQEGIPAITTGGVTSISKLDFGVLSGKQVFICLDTDGPGKKAVPDYIKKLEDINCPVMVLELPDEVKDVCEYFTSGKKSDDFSELMMAAKTSDEWVLSKNKEIRILEGKDFMEIEYPKSTWLIDKFIRADGLNIIQGESGVGKTTIAHSIIKAVLSGTSWIKDELKATKTNVLFLDKENSPIDNQKRFREMGIPREGMYWYEKAEFLQLLDGNGNLTEEADYLRRFIKSKGIGLILFDSMADFFVGSENDAGDAAVNILAWKQICGNACQLVLHHEKKPMNGARGTGINRARGSTHIVASAQSIVGLSVDEARPEVITVDHIKVRGARKMNPFLLKMKIKNVYMTDETIVYDFEWGGEVQNSKRARAEAEDAILAFFEVCNDWYCVDQIRGGIIGEISERLIREALRTLVSINTLEEQTRERGKKYYRQII